MQKKSAVLHFVDEERKKGTSDKKIQHHLLDAGWQMDIIQHVMNPKDDTKSASHNPNNSAGPQIPNQLRNPFVIAGTVFLFFVLLALFI